MLSLVWNMNILNKNKYYIPAVVLILLAFIAGWFITSMAANHQNVASVLAQSKIAVLIGDDKTLASHNTNQCYSSNWIHSLFKQRDCIWNESAYYSTDDDQIMESLYALATSNGWSVLDNGRTDNFGFDSAGYMEAIVNDSSETAEASQSNLTVRVLSQKDVDSLSNLLTADQLQSLKAASGTIIQINVATQYRG